MKWFYILLFAWLFSSGLLAQDTSTAGNGSIPKIKFSGYGYYMLGMIVSGVLGDEWEEPTTINHLWSNTCLVRPGMSVNATDWFTLNLGGELYMQYYSQSMGKVKNRTPYFKTNNGLTEANLHWNFEHPVLSNLKLEVGLFPYVINPQVKTLGNYLFRSTVHPVSVQNKVDYPWTNLLGIVIDVGFIENKITFEAILASELNYISSFDFTPAAGLYYKPNDVIDIGTAIAIHHALQGNAGLMPDSLSKKWQGTKIDTRAIFDPKPIFGGMDFLGANEFKIYAELAFLGLKDTLEVDTSNLAILRSNDTTELRTLVFPANSILHRMPFMIGINLPTWKLLDLLAIELEWFYSPYANDWFGLFDAQKAEARQPASLKKWDNYINKDNFKWSVYARKAVGKFEARAILGSDHNIYRQTGNFEQALKRPEDWLWYVQLRYNL